jgi:TonB-dependent SusC/RagA subfamily outer membrane receptor
MKKLNILICLIFFTFTSFSQDDKVEIDSTQQSISIDKEESWPFGTMKKISPANFNQGLIIHPQELIIGQSPGLIIYPSTIDFEMDPVTRISGISTISGNPEPLFIVDGIPLEGSFLSFLNSDDIEEIKIIRDASASAIYGSQAVNGAIVISTRSNEINNSLKLNYHGYVGMSQVAQRQDLLSGDEIRRIIYDDEYDLYPDGVLNVLGNSNTNWQSELFRTAVSHNHYVGISGGILNFPYRVSLGYIDKSGVLKNTGTKRTTGTFVLAPSFFKNSLTISIKAYGAITNDNLADIGALRSAYSMDPTQNIHDGNESSNGYFQWENYGAGLGTPNPVEQLLEADHKDKTKRYITDFMIQYRFPFLRGLNVNFSRKAVSSDLAGHDNRPVTSPATLTYGNSWGQLIDYTNIYKSKLTDAHLQYANDLQKIKSRINLSTGYSHQRFEESGTNFHRSVTDETHPYELFDSTKYHSENYLISFYARISYDYKSKYFLSMSFRREGSSSYTEKNQWHNFPFLQLSWDLKTESFLKNLHFISVLNLTYALGKSGQFKSSYSADDYNKYVLSHDGSYYPVDGTYIPTLRPGYDVTLKWETVTTQNVGFNLGLLKNRIHWHVNLYRKRSEDVISAIPIPTGSNFSNNLLVNFAEIENKGLKALLSYIL